MAEHGSEHYRGLATALIGEWIGAGSEQQTSDIEVALESDAGERCLTPVIASFGYGTLFDRLTPGTTIDLAVEPGVNEYQGYRNVELEVKDVQFPGA